MTRPNFSSTPLRLVVYLILSYSLVALFFILIPKLSVKTVSARTPVESAKTKTADSRRTGDGLSPLETNDFHHLQYNSQEQTPTNLLALYFDIQDPLSLLRNRHTAISDSFFSFNRRTHIKHALVPPAWLLPMPILLQGGNKVAFTSNRDGSAQILVMDTDGSAQTPLTNNEANDESPRWSPNNTRILFHSDRDNPFSGSAEIYVMNADGTSQTRLTNNTADDSCAAWSPDGNQIIFQSARNGLYYQVYVMNADGTNQVNVSNGNTNDGQPSWSPNGTRIAFTSERDHPGTPTIYVMNADGSNQTRLTFNAAGVRDEQPAWSPDGTKIAFVSTRDSVVESWQETDDEGGIINRMAVHTNKEIYLMNSDGSNQMRLTNTLGHDDTPSWSGDGMRIVFRSDRERECCDPVSQVWVMNADGSNQVDLTNSWSGDYCPSWQHGNTYATEDNATEGNATAGQIIIDFDTLPTGIAVTNQYQPSKYATFSSTNATPVTDYAYSSASWPNVLSRANGFGINRFADLIVNFTQPVNNLTFKMTGIHQYYPVADVDFYVNGTLNRTISLTACGYYCDITVAPANLGINNITKVVIRNIVDPYGIDFDNFVFTPSASATPTPTPETKVDVAFQSSNTVITNTTQKAQNGDEIALQAIVTPNAELTDSYSWSISGPYQLISGSLSGTAIKFRYTQAGNYTATLTHSRRNTNRTALVNFNVLPKVESVNFEPVDPGNFLSANPNPGGGLRIYPDKLSVSDTSAQSFDRRRVRVKAVTTAGANKTVYFKSFDVDDPSANSAPIDPLDQLSTDLGNDNRGTPKVGTFSNCDSLGASVCFSVTDSNGVATIEFITTMHPGDNFVIAASGDLGYLNELTLAADGISLKDNIGQAPSMRAKVSQMLTVWRRLHIEVDSMGLVTDNVVTGTITSIQQVNETVHCGDDPQTGAAYLCLRVRTDVCVDRILERYRFENGRLVSNGNSFKVMYNDKACVTLGYDNYNVQAGTPFTLYDDDDYNSNDGAILDGDNGEDVDEIANKTFAFMRPSDLPSENLYAAAYIMPEYYEMNMRGYNNNNVPFALNVPGSITAITDQLDRGRGSGNIEGDDFWVVYVQLAYQGDLSEDGDGDILTNGTREPATGGITVGALGDVARSEPEVPRGGDGSLIFLEASRDKGMIENWDILIRVLPHEIGHQFGLRGDSLGAVWGIMNSIPEPLYFHPEHINMLRWRVKSPGQQ